MNPARLNHRMNVMRLREGSVDGASTTTWVTVRSARPCRLDLTPGGDPAWSPEAGRAPDRLGVIFVNPARDEIKPGDRLVITHGPKGTFELDGEPVEEWDSTVLDHLELYVREVAKPIGV